MNSSKNNKESDMVNTRQEYLNVLDMEIQLNKIVEDAVMNQKMTGLPPPITQMRDTRTTTEKFADVQKMKIQLIKDLEPIMDPQLAVDVVGKIMQSPLNVDNKLFIFLSQRVEELVKSLKKIYKYGIEGDINDAEFFVNFVNSMYQDKNSKVSSVKSFINRMGSRDINSLKSKGDRNFTDINAMSAEIKAIVGITYRSISNEESKEYFADKTEELLYDIMKYFTGYNLIFPKSDELLKTLESASLSEDYANNTLIEDYLHYINNNLPNFDLVYSLLTRLNQKSQNIKKYEASYNPSTYNRSVFNSLVSEFQEVMINIMSIINNGETLQELQQRVQMAESVKNIFSKTPSRPIVTKPTEDLPFTTIDIPSSDTSNSWESSRPSPGSSMRSALTIPGSILSRINEKTAKPIIKAEMDYIGKPIARAGMEYVVNPATKTGMDYVVNPTARMIGKVTQPIMSVARPIGRVAMATADTAAKVIPPVASVLTAGLSDDISKEVEEYYFPRSEELEREISTLNSSIEPALKKINEEIDKITASRRTQAQKDALLGPLYDRYNNLMTQVSRRETLKKELGQLNSSVTSDATRSVARRTGRTMRRTDPTLPQGNGISTKPTTKLTDAFKTGFSNFGSSDKRVKKLGKMFKSGNTKISDIPMPIGHVLKPIAGDAFDAPVSTGRTITGNGLTTKERFLKDHDPEQGIQPSIKYVRFGKYYVNKHLLDNDRLSIRSANGNGVPALPSYRMSKGFGMIIRRLIGGSTPSHEEINSLTSEEKAYLAKVSRLSKISDKIALDTPSKDTEEKDIHRFNVLKGEIMAGNDSKEVIKEFKILALKLSNNNILPKKQINEILQDLLAMGY